MDIKEIQRRLIDLGFSLGRSGADGDVGPITISAVTAYQRLSGLPPTGLLDDALLTALGIVGPGAVTPSAQSPAEVAVGLHPGGEPSWLTLARADIGTLEGKGALNNPKVVAYYADAGFPGIKQDSVAWCAAFVGAKLARAGLRTTKSLMARSYEAWGLPLTGGPILGCVGVKTRAGAPGQGHVGFVVGASSDKIIMVGGNQSDSVSIASFPRKEFTAFRWPADGPPPITSMPLPTTVAGAKAGVREA